MVLSTLNEQPLLLGHPRDVQEAEGLRHHPALPRHLPAHASPRRDGAARGGVASHLGMCHRASLLHKSHSFRV